MDYDELEDFIFELRDEQHELSVGMPDFIKPEEVLPFKEPMNLAYRSMQKEYRIPEFMGCANFEDAKFPDTIHAIRSMVGDDETITTNCLMYAALCIVAGPIITRIKISWSDVQFNKYMYNYAEGWVFLPPSAESSFESVNRYAKRNGVPFVLDPIKFKNLSAVRKQSDMDVDLPSKFSSLAKSAAWTCKSWFTWDMHQLALVLGLEVFDFTKSKLFPFLYRWEGGCGGGPPWGNLLTAVGAIHRHRRGRATKGILGVMADANALHNGTIAPKDAIFAKSLTLALSGDARWLQIRNELENQRDETADLGLPVFNTRIMEVADRTIPKTLISKSEVIDPGDALTGVAISFLREKGYIMTEVDLVTFIEDRKRLDAIWGQIPLREIEDQIELRKKEYQESFLETISVVATKIGNSNTRVYGKYGEIGKPSSPWALAEMGKYYTMRVEQSSYFTSFIYNEQVRVFKRADVEEEFSRGLGSLRDAFCESVESRYRPDERRSIVLPYEREQHDEIDKWINSGSLPNLLRGPIPPGIGPDDARITRDAVEWSVTDRGAGATGLLYLIISSDKRLIHSVQAIVQHENPRSTVRVVGMSVLEFIAYCVTPWRRGNQSRDADWLRNMQVYNPYMKVNEPVHGALLGALRKEGFHLHRERIISGRVFYDYPNINRNLKRFTVDPESGLVQEWSGGFLTTARATADRALAAKDIRDISNIVDFMHMQKRNIAPITDRAVKLHSAKRGAEIGRAHV